MTGMLIQSIYKHKRLGLKWQTFGLIKRLLLIQIAWGREELSSHGYRLPDYISKFTDKVSTGRLNFNPLLYLVLTFFRYLRRQET